MRVTVDTNVLVRGVVLDDLDQARFAAELLRTAELIAVTLPALCEFVWVLTRGYRCAAREVLGMIRSLLDSAAVRVDRPAVEAGLGPCSKRAATSPDGVIAFDGRRWLGGEVFVSFDPKAVELIASAGGEARLLQTQR